MSSSAIASAQNRCGAKTRDGGSCTQWPVKGTTRCKMHGGLAPRVQAKVRAMQLRARINGELQALGWEPVIDPIPRYAELAGETLAFKDLARERINELGSWQQANEFDSLDIHAAVKVYEWALEQSERIWGACCRWDSGDFAGGCAFGGGAADPRAGGDVDGGARHGVKRSASFGGSRGRPAGGGGCDGRGRHRCRLTYRDLGFSHDLEQLALHAAYISNQFGRGQRVGADSEIAGISVELDLCRRRILAVLLAIALPGALSFGRLPPVLEETSEFNRLGLQVFVEPRCITAEHLQHTVQVLHRDHQKYTSAPKIAFGRSISGVTRIISPSVRLSMTAR